MNISQHTISTLTYIISDLRHYRPATRQDLHNYLKAFLGITVPDQRLCPGHNSPMDYVWHSFANDYAPAAANPDCIVWANRGGGKTQLAAAVTLLDSIFKPNCQSRILGGSFEQSMRMYEYLLNFAHTDFVDLLQKPATANKCEFLNRAKVEVLTQSAANVRGRHVHKVRCDEIELFDRDVFAAAQYITQSTDDIRGALEIFSTMHRPYGLMQSIVDNAHVAGTNVFRWCVWEVIEQCRDRQCSQCPLWNDCQGKAKAARGYFKIDDAIAQMLRSSRASWECEMLCKRPNHDNLVFADFDTAVHVRPIQLNPNLPLYRTIDFGYVNPFVCLWVQVDDEGVVRVIDEYLRSRATINFNAEQIKSRFSHPITATYCDPAGAGANDVTGSSTVSELRRCGVPCRYMGSPILDGVEFIRRALRDGHGQSTLIIDPRCAKLIEAMRCYHYPDDSPQCELPLKDGIYDHPIDALRYFFVNYHQRLKSKVTVVNY